MIIDFVLGTETWIVILIILAFVSYVAGVINGRKLEKQKNYFNSLARQQKELEDRFIGKVKK